MDCVNRVLKWISERFRRDFDFSAGHIFHFTKSQWESFDLKYERTHGPSQFFLYYRMIYCAIFMVLIFYSFVCPTNLYFIFLTNWSLLFQAGYSLLTLLAVILEMIRHKRKQKIGSIDSSFPKENLELGVQLQNEGTIMRKSEDTATSDPVVVLENEEKINTEPPNNESGIESGLHVDEMATELTHKPSVSYSNHDINASNPDITFPPINLLHKVIWIVTNIVYVLPHVVTLAFWIIVYDPREINSTDCIRWRTFFLVHSTNSVLAIVDFCIVAIPKRFFHFVFASALSAVYCLWTYIYHVSWHRYLDPDKPYIYSMFNWKEEPKRAVIASFCATFIAAPIAHFVFCYLLYKLRSKVVKMWKKRQVNAM